MVRWWRKGRDERFIASIRLARLARLRGAFERIPQLLRHASEICFDIKLLSARPSSHNNNNNS